MNKIFKIFLLSIIFILFFLLILYYVLIGKHKVYCNSYNTEYYNWLPYEKGDSVIFTNNSIDKLYLVLNYTSNHSDSYYNNVKCSCCEDNLYTLLVNKADSIEISLENLYPKKSCLGTSIMINKNFMQLYKKDLEAIINKNIIEINDYKIIKNKGITEFKYKNEVWKLKRIVKSNIKNNVTIQPL